MNPENKIAYLDFNQLAKDFLALSLDDRIKALTPDGNDKTFIVGKISDPDALKELDKIVELVKRHHVANNEENTEIVAKLLMTVRAYCSLDLSPYEKRKEFKQSKDNMIQRDPKKRTELLNDIKSHVEDVKTNWYPNAESLFEQAEKQKDKAEEKIDLAKLLPDINITQATSKKAPASNREATAPHITNGEQSKGHQAPKQTNKFKRPLLLLIASIIAVAAWKIINT